MKTMWKPALLRAAKYAFGACVAIAIALGLGLQYPTAAGIITLLSLQDTKKETLRTAARRIPIFLAAVGIAFICFQLLGYSVAALGLYLLAFVLLCHVASAGADIAMCSVLITHFWVAQSMSAELFWNELLLLVIGAGIGILLNLFLPVRVSEIRHTQREIDSAIQRVLEEMAQQVTRPPAQFLQGLAELEQSLSRAQQQVRKAADNALTMDLSYYKEYVDMRTNQFLVLGRIQTALQRLHGAPVQAGWIADFLRRISATFHESNNAVALLKDAEEIRAKFRASELPQNRQEFEDRAALLHLFNELEHFLLLKRTFAQSLTPEQCARYWADRSLGQSGKDV